MGKKCQMKTQVGALANREISYSLFNKKNNYNIWYIYVFQEIIGLLKITSYIIEIYQFFLYLLEAIT